MGFTYAKAGVNVRSVRDVQSGIQKAVKSTVGKEVVLGVGHYAGLIKSEQELLALHTDGVGSKVLIAQMLDKYDTVGIDCVAMNVNDIVCVGAKPLALVDYLAVERLDHRMIGQIVKGLVKGANIAHCSIIGGETAIVPDLIKGMHGKGFDLSATVLGVMQPGKVVTGKGIQYGDVVIGLESSGLHSNGYTLARKVLLKKDRNDKKVLMEMLTPTTIYSPAILEVLKEAEVHGMAHITGGAFSKLERITFGKGVLLDETQRPPEIFRRIEAMGSISKREMYRTFNMGIGFCIVAPRKEEEKIVKVCARNGIKAQAIGRIAGRDISLKIGKEIYKLN